MPINVKDAEQHSQNTHSCWKISLGENYVGFYDTMYINLEQLICYGIIIHLFLFL